MQIQVLGGFFLWVDPGFPEGGTQIYCLVIFFAENCMKMKEIIPMGACIPSAPLGSATDSLVSVKVDQEIDDRCLAPTEPLNLWICFLCMRTML